MKKPVRVRFAPSPTGPLHIGGVRTALFNYLFAKKHNGTFVLRIEDTDQSRYVLGAEKYIVEALNWCHISFDEGPDNSGDYGPYRQSERKSIYKKYIGLLIQKGKAYYAFDSAEELANERKKHEEKGKTFIYNWHNRTKGRLINSLVLSKEETNEKIKNGTPYVIRFLMPEGQTISLNDMIRGSMSINSNTLDDKILFKSDGMPTYHLANVVDDHLMEISHVIRGEEWLPSLALHQLLYNAFQWNKPIFAHLPLILKPTGKGKLSKRDGEKFGIPVYPIEWKESESLTYKGFREIGFEIEAFINFICMIGWNPGTEDEIFTLETLTKIFDTKRIIKSGAKYDYEKAKWFNLEHLKKIETDSLKKEFENKILKANKDFLEEKMLDKLIDLAKNRINFRKNLAEETNKILSYDENKLRDNLLKINFNSGLIKLIEFFQKEIKTTNNLKDLKEKYFLISLSSNRNSLALVLGSFSIISISLSNSKEKAYKMAIIAIQEAASII